MNPSIVADLKEVLKKLIEICEHVVKNPPTVSNPEDYSWIFDYAEDIPERIRPYLPPDEYDWLCNRVRTLKEAFKAIVEDTWQPDF